MGNRRYTDEFKVEAVGQIIERGDSVKEASDRIGVSTHSLYKWLKDDPRNPKSSNASRQNGELEFEVARLKSELRRVREEQDILRKTATYFANQPE